MFIEVLLLCDSFLCNFEFELCVLSHFQRRGLTSVYTVIVKIEKCIAYAISCTLYKLWWHSYIVRDTLMIRWPVGKPVHVASCMQITLKFLMAICLTSLATGPFYYTHTFVKYRRIKTLLYYVFIMDKVHTVANRRQVLFKQFWKCIVCIN